MSFANKLPTPFPEALERWFSTITNVWWKCGWINIKISSMQLCQVSFVLVWLKRSKRSMEFRTEERRRRRRFRASSSSRTSKMQRLPLVSAKHLSREFDARRLSPRRSGQSIALHFFPHHLSLSLVRSVEKRRVRLCWFARLRQREWRQSKCRNLSLSQSRW